jgi:hypothetical protein
MLEVLIMLSGYPDVEVLRRQFAVMPAEQVVVEMAEQLWQKKAGVEPKDLRIPIVIHMFDERCVWLKLPLPSVGGEPIYCFKKYSDELVRSHDDVE